jgi:hypothetical protein
MVVAPEARGQAELLEIIDTCDGLGPLLLSREGIDGLLGAVARASLQPLLFRAKRGQLLGQGPQLAGFGPQRLQFLLASPSCAGRGGRDLLCAQPIVFLLQEVDGGCGGA